MDIRLLRRPLISLAFDSSQLAFVGNVAARRYESSFRRTKKLQNVKPAEVFVFSKSTPKLDHMIFNPPASAPSVLHTPLKFLPKDDKRRELFADSTNPNPINPLRLPLAHKPFPKTYQRHHLTEDDVAEMIRLRTLDVEKWSFNSLARKFNTTVFFVKICVKRTEEPKAAHDKKRAAELAEHEARRGPRRRKALEDKARRWEKIIRDE